jgi:hypothetical protein
MAQEVGNGLGLDDGTGKVLYIQPSLQEINTKSHTLVNIPKRNTRKRGKNQNQTQKKAKELQNK